MTFLDALRAAKQNGQWIRPVQSYAIETGPLSYVGFIAWDNRKGWIFVPSSTGGTPATIPDLSLMELEWKVLDPVQALKELHHMQD